MKNEGMYQFLLERTVNNPDCADCTLIELPFAFGLNRDAVEHAGRIVGIDLQGIALRIDGEYRVFPWSAVQEIRLPRIPGDSKVVIIV